MAGVAEKDELAVPRMQRLEVRPGERAELAPGALGDELEALADGLGVVLRAGCSSGSSVPCRLVIRAQQGTGADAP